MMRDPFEFRCVGLHVSPLSSVCTLKEVQKVRMWLHIQDQLWKNGMSVCVRTCTHTHTRPAPRNHSGTGNGKGVPSAGNSELEQLNFSKSSATDQLGRQEALLSTPTRGLSFSLQSRETSSRISGSSCWWPFHIT